VRGSTFVAQLFVALLADESRAMEILADWLGGHSLTDDIFSQFLYITPRLQERFA
jgi:hypothetical protein